LGKRREAIKDEGGISYVMSSNARGTKGRGEGRKKKNVPLRIFPVTMNNERGGKGRESDGVRNLMIWRCPS